MSRVEIRLASPEPGLLVIDNTRNTQTLCVSDLHIGYERELAAKGYTIPSQTERMAARLLALIEKWDVDHLCLLGDVKHAVAELPMAEWAEVPTFFEKISAAVKRVDVYPGNHDGGLKELTPRNVVFHPVEGGTIYGGRVALQHGHAWPTPEMLRCEYFILGHHHPVVELEDAMRNVVRLNVWLMGRWNREEVRRRMEGHLARTGKKAKALRPGNPRIVILPSFNPLVPGRVVNVESWRPASPILKAGCFSEDQIQVFTLDGTFLDHLPRLRRAGPA
jgi:putative SbcD/Mre11-related phosphoesterase